MADISSRPTWDEICSDAGVIERISPTTSIQYMRTKGIWPTAPRIALVLAFVVKLEDGRYLNITKSVDSHPGEQTAEVLIFLDFTPPEGDVR